MYLGAAYLGLFALAHAAVRRWARYADPLILPCAALLRPGGIGTAGFTWGTAGECLPGNGAKLWLRLGGLSIQPGEFAKILLIVFVAVFLVNNQKLFTTAGWPPEAWPAPAWAAGDPN